MFWFWKICSRKVCKNIEIETIDFTRQKQTIPVFSKNCFRQHKVSRLVQTFVCYITTAREILLSSKLADHSNHVLGSAISSRLYGDGNENSSDKGDWTAAQTKDSWWQDPRGQPTCPDGRRHAGAVHALHDRRVI